MRNLGYRGFILLTTIRLITAASVSYAGFERRAAGARSLALAGAPGSFGEDCWSFYLNPARCANLRQLNVFYSPSTLGLSEIRTTGISFRGHLLSFDFGAAAQTFGYDLYRESIYTVNLSRPISDFFFLGCNLNINHLFIKGYGTGICGSIDLGTRLFLSDHIAISVATTNVNSASMTATRDKLPQTISFGCGLVSERVNVAVEYFKELGFPSSVRLAAEYSPIREFTLRGGTASGTNTIHAGLACRLLAFELEYGMAYHQFLGITHCIGLSFKISGGGASEFESISKYRSALRSR